MKKGEKWTIYTERNKLSMYEPDVFLYTVKLGEVIFDRKKLDTF